MIENKPSFNIFWFRRDLRLYDNTGLNAALKGRLPVLPIFIFDTHTTEELSPEDARLNFVYDTLRQLHTTLISKGSSLHVYRGDPSEIISSLLTNYSIETVYTNREYEPYTRLRDSRLSELCKRVGAEFKTFKDSVIFEQSDILTSYGKPYTVYTPYKNAWRRKYLETNAKPAESVLDNFVKTQTHFPTRSELNLSASTVSVVDYNLKHLSSYESDRNVPEQDNTTYLGPHLRYGTVSIRQLVSEHIERHETFVDELIWREFFMQILWHFPHTVDKSFKPKYDHIQWENNQTQFETWKEGKTGFPIVDAGMRQLVQTGYMHNRVRMIAASFLIKDLLIDWRWGEAFFAQHLLDYELASNVGNWQWAAGSGCDAAPYFRIFNPTTQRTTYDPDLVYCRRWIPELDDLTYPAPMTDHRAARIRTLERYKKALSEG